MVKNVNSLMGLINWKLTWMWIIHIKPNPAMHFSKKVIANMDTDATSSIEKLLRLLKKPNGKRSIPLTGTSFNVWVMGQKVDFWKFWNEVLRRTYTTLILINIYFSLSLMFIDSAKKILEYSILSLSINSSLT